MTGRTSGFTLIEVSASLAIFAVMTLVFAAVYQTLSEGAARNAQELEINDTVDQLKTHFAEFEDYCRSNFGGVALGAAAPDGQSLASIGRFDQHGNRLGDILRRGSALASGAVVDDIRLVPSFTLNSMYMVATLSLRFRRPTGAALERSVPIYAAVNNGTVVRCSTLASNSMVIRDQVCRMQNGGFASYNAVTQNCIDDPRVQWNNGSLTAARCPAGFVLSAHREDPGAAGVACSATPRGVPVRARTYTNGERAGGVEVVTYSAVVDWTTQECRFVYPATEDLANVTTHVRCVPAGALPL